MTIHGHGCKFHMDCPDLFAPAGFQSATASYSNLCVQPAPVNIFHIDFVSSAATQQKYNR